MNQKSKIKNKILALVLLGGVVATILPPVWVQAQITDCDAQVSPNQVASGSTTSFSIVITNGSAQRIRWVKFSRPSANFTLSGVSASGWSVVSSDATSITVNGNTINTGASRTFTLTDVVAASVNAPSANWSVEAAANGSGTDPYACTGNLGTQIGTPDTTEPVISGISVSNVGAASATISWTTDEPANSRVNYGLTSGYGSNVSSATLTTSHSLNLIGLTANTGYHFQVVSADASDNTASSSDNTFLTQAISTTGTNSNSANPSTPKPVTNNGDTVPPTVSITTDLSKPFAEAPTIQGTASDNVAVSLIEYSTDGGVNYLPVDKNSGLPAEQVSFEFRPLGLPDGNYDLFIRVTDSGGNEALSSKAILIIDKLPPLIGPNIISFGSQLSTATAEVMFAVIGVDEKITLSTIGGPTSVVIKAETSEGKAQKFFSLTRSAGTNLWSGILAFGDSGVYSMEAVGVDGANNRTSRKLNTVYVHEPSQVISSQGKGIDQAKVVVKYFDPGSSSWYVWDAAAFGQSNPQTTNQNGEFDFFLPAGKFYLEVSAPGFYSKKSEIFVKKEAGPIAAEIVLERTFALGIGNFNVILPKLSLAGFVVGSEKDVAQDILTDGFKGQSLPNFELASTDSEAVRSVDLSGKKSLVSFITTWSPTGEEQISQLSNLAQTNQYKVFVIMPLESSEKVKAYKRIGSYKVEFIFDPLGKTLSDFNVLSVPKHVFVGRDLKVYKSVDGLLKKEELQETLDKL